jgi:hypothetical protein
MLVLWNLTPQSPLHQVERGLRGEVNNNSLSETQVMEE